MGYKILTHSLYDTPARHLDLTSWPSRDCIRLPITYCEWFDWAVLLVQGAEERLLAIANHYSSRKICLSLLQTDVPADIPQELRTIELDTKSIHGLYFEAIWDKKFFSPSGPLAAFNRTVLIWDKSEKWIVLNDRFFEIGLFAAFDAAAQKLKQSFFPCLDSQVLLDRFAQNIRANRVASLIEVDRWFNPGK